MSLKSAPVRFLILATVGLAWPPLTVAEGPPNEQRRDNSTRPVARAESGRASAEEAPAFGDDRPRCDRIRFFPAPGRERAMLGGKFSGSNTSTTEGYTTLWEIKDVPPPGQWSELSFPNDKVYRWLRYEGPAGSNAAVAEVEFYSGARKLSGFAFASPNEAPGRLGPRAFDRDVTTVFQSQPADGRYVGLDLGDRATALVPRMQPPPGEFAETAKVTLACPTPGASIRYTTDGTLPGPGAGTPYDGPITVDRTTTITAVSFKEGQAPSPAAFGTYLVAPAPGSGLSTFHFGNSLTGSTRRFALYARTAGYPHVYFNFTAPGAWTKQLWEVERTKQAARWDEAMADLRRIDHFTLQPRDFDVAEEADYDARFIRLIRRGSPEAQPWLYCEWVERARQRPTDRGTVASSQLKTIHPALT